MKSLFLPIIALVLMLFYGRILQAELQAQDTQHVSSDKTTELIPVAPAEKEIVKLTDRGIDPQTIILKTMDSSVFFVNVTKDSLITLNVDYGKHRLHCASSNMKFDSNGVMKTLRPIGPQDFAIMCFPEQGTYTVSVQGLGGNSKEHKSQVVVE